MQTQAPQSIPAKRGLLKPKAVTEEGMKDTHMTCPRPGVMKGICSLAFNSRKRDCMQRENLLTAASHFPFENMFQEHAGKYVRN